MTFRGASRPHRTMREVVHRRIVIIHRRAYRVKWTTRLLLVYWVVIGLAWFFLTRSMPMSNVEAGLTIAAAAVCLGGGGLARDAPKVSGP
jgi:hypothetical protein